ncbi:MAG: hypothetical protein RIC55_01185 [Pirellulaceae bacterium]
MFGKAQWFRPSRGAKGIVPATWQGWAYTAAWGGVVAFPAAALAANVGLFQSLIWLAASGGMWFVDVMQVRRDMNPSPAASSPSSTPAVDENVLYIGDDETTDRLATQHFEMQLRK